MALDLLILGTRIVEWRSQRKMSRADLSRKTFLAYQTVWRIEKGLTKNPQIGTIRKIAEALEIGVGELLKEGDTNA